MDELLKLKAYIDGCINDWEKITETIPESDRQDLSDIASNASAYLAGLSEYLGYRGGYGFGDHGHNKAINAMTKRRRKVRKALGYTYP